MHTTLKLLLLLLTLCCLPQQIQAVQVSPFPVQVTQPDGTRITLQPKGTRELHWYEDKEGYSVLHDRGKRRYVYADLDNNRHFKKSRFEVGKVRPQDIGLKKHIKPPGEVRQAIHDQRQLIGGISTSTLPRTAAAVSGNIKNLVILVRFANHVNRILPSNSDLGVLFNHEGPHATLAPTGSVRDVYLENSYGAVSLDSTVVGWITVSNTEQYYANGTSGDSTLWQALVEALNTADSSIDFSQFDQNNDGYIDSIAFIHSGYGAEWGGSDSDGVVQDDRIWSHKWKIQPEWVSAEGVRVSNYNISPSLWGTSGTNIGRIGVIAHELGHFLGLPDLYDTDQSSEGIGSWGLMANSWGFDNSQLHPPHFSPWSKIQLGWLVPTVLTDAGTYTLSAVETTPQVYKIDINYPGGEYLLIENRQPLGFETAIPQGGVAIWHIDDALDSNKKEGYPGQTGWPENGKHYQVSLLQADGRYHLEKDRNRGDSGDLYHAGNKSLISNTTTPNTDAYQNGNTFDTGHTLSDISSSSNLMSFYFNGVTIPEGEYYVRRENVLSDWINTDAGNEYQLSDDNNIEVLLGFDFQFYGVVHNNIRISSNGYLTFTTSGDESSQTSIPDSAPPNDLIAPYWTDLNPENGGFINSLVEGTSPNKRITITWKNIPHYFDIGASTFQATLYESTGDIVFRYQDVDFDNVMHSFGANATIGIENSDATLGVLYSFNQENSIANGDAIRFSRKKDILLVDDDNDSPDNKQSYTSVLDGLGRLYDNWSVNDNGGGPNLSTLEKYKSVIWFTGADSSITTGPDSSEETHLVNYLENGGCVFISSQDYLSAAGQTNLIENYLGVSASEPQTGHSSITGNSSVYDLSGTLMLNYPFLNNSDTLIPAPDAHAAVLGDQGIAAVYKATLNYRTIFAAFPFEAIESNNDRISFMDKSLRFCDAIEIDTDADGLMNSFELFINTDLTLADSDLDGISDFDEVGFDGDVNTYTLGVDLNPLSSDSDDDGLNDALELSAGTPGIYDAGIDTNPLNADTDGDGFNDGVEVNAGSDPVDSISIPAYGHITGDITGDGIVNAADILAAIQISSGIVTLSVDDPGFSRGDVAPLTGGISTPDGEINAGDVLLIQRKAFGMIDF